MSSLLYAQYPGVLTLLSRKSAGLEYGFDTTTKIEPGVKDCYPIGLAINIPHGHVGIQKLKPFAARKYNVMLVSELIDNNENITATLYNYGKTTVEIPADEKIFELFIIKCDLSKPVLVPYEELLEAEDSKRNFSDDDVKLNYENLFPKREKSCDNDVEEHVFKKQKV